jgi:hypothetical protein
LGLGLLNAINIFGGSGLAVAFAYVATYANYTTAWLVAGVLALVPLPLLVLVTGHRRSDRTEGINPSATPIHSDPRG